jgi:hypothetical protein
MRFGGVFCALLLAGTGAASAQHPSHPHRSGLWGEIGFGPGHVRIACSTCTDVFGANGATTNIRIGGTVSDHVLIGFELFSLLDKAFSFATGDSVNRAGAATAAVVVIWFPGRRGLFLKGGVGAAAGQFVVPNGTTRPDTRFLISEVGPSATMRPRDISTMRSAYSSASSR